MVVPELNANQCRMAMPTIEMFSWADGEGPESAISEAAATLAASPARIALDPEMRAQSVLDVISQFGASDLVDATPAATRARARKSSSEIELLRASAASADRAMEAAFGVCQAGVSELDIAGAVHSAFLTSGSESVAFVTVGSGPNGAFPHHDVSSRRVRTGDAIVLDIGGIREGYASDLARMVHVGPPDEEFLRLFDLVESALLAGLATARPGATCGDVDRAAREVIERAGFGEKFTHRTGHGIGLSGHEGPSIAGGDETILETGMTFSIEPGVYLEGRFGIRLEEIVVLAEGGPEILGSLPRDLIVVDP